jgi:TolC family type I secretion outer membrane protein
MMVRFALPGLVVAMLVGLAPVNLAATTLEDALVLAYQNNPRLLAARAELRGVDEGVPQAIGLARPSVAINGEAGEGWNDSNVTSSGWRTPRSIELAVSQPIYRGGSIDAAKAGAESDVLASRARLGAVEQQVFGDVVVAFMNVVRDEATLALRENNEQVLVRQLQATQDRFEVGEVTRTDVAQSESRLALATAQRIEAEGVYRASLAVYQEVVGVPAENLDEPAPLAGLPASENEVVAGAEGTPNVIAARYDLASAESSIEEEYGNLLPRFDIVGRVSADQDVVGNGTNTQTASILAELTVPLYQGGVEYSQVRQSKQLAAQRREELETQRRNAIQEAVASWQALATAAAQIDSFEAQVRATQLALEGVREEATVGARTVLDILDAEQEALDAQVSLVRARRDLIVAGYAVLRAVGSLTADQIGLPVDYYDPDLHYQAVRDQIWGTEPPVE